MSEAPLDWQTEALKNQAEMVAYLKILSDEEQIERAKTVIVQQAMMIHEINNLHQAILRATENLRLANEKISAAFWNLMKVPIACMVIGVASWAYLYSKVISEHTWLLMLAIAVFPWLGDSITAVTKIFRSSGNARTEEKK
jgi:hypothetical protein